MIGDTFPSKELGNNSESSDNVVGEGLCILPDLFVVSFSIPRLDHCLKVKVKDNGSCMHQPHLQLSSLNNNEL